jgi:hypothetical protein
VRFVQAVKNRRPGLAVLDHPLTSKRLEGRVTGLRVEIHEAREITPGMLAAGPHQEPEQGHLRACAEHIVQRSIELHG